jgi:hypothetical protein
VPLIVVGTKRDEVEKFHAPSAQEYIAACGDTAKLEELEVKTVEKTEKQLGRLLKGLEEIQEYKANGSCFISKGKTFTD